MSKDVGRCAGLATGIDLRGAALIGVFSWIARGVIDVCTAVNRACGEEGSVFSFAAGILDACAAGLAEAVVAFSCAVLKDDICVMVLAGTAGIFSWTEILVEVDGAGILSCAVGTGAGGVTFVVDTGSCGDVPDDKPEGGGTVNTRTDGAGAGATGTDLTRVEDTVAEGTCTGLIRVDDTDDSRSEEHTLS